MAGGLMCHSGTNKLDRLPERFSRTTISPSYRSPPPYPSSMDRQSPSDDSRAGSHHNRPRLPSISNLLSATTQSTQTFQQPDSSPAILSSPPTSLRGTLSPDQEIVLPSPPPRGAFQLPPLERPSGQGRDLPQFTPVTEATSERTEQFVGSRGVLFNPPNPFASPSPQAQPFGPTSLPETTPNRRLVREGMVPGKGLCYIYDDGTSCQTSINGDPVNPKWGTTKAGKPRKRLGQACNACREKKIKCDPGIPRCSQCQKSNRECRFETTYASPTQPGADGSLMTGSVRANSRSQNTPSARESPSAPDVNPRQFLERTGSNASLENQQDQAFTRTDSRTSMNVENLLSPAMTDNTENTDIVENERPFKRPKFSTSSEVGSSSKPSDQQSEDGGQTLEESIPTRSGSRFGISADPFMIDDRLTLFYLNHFFSQINCTAYTIFPQKAFMKWVRDDNDKSYWDHMLLYAMMALGSIFASGDTSHHRTVFVKIAEEAANEETDASALQLVQTRLILSILAYSRNDVRRSWDLCGSTVRMACEMQLNTEADTIQPSESTGSCFGLDSSTYAECRRRTFWAAYIMDCFHGCSIEYISAINKADCELKLPCPESKYEEGDIPEMPIFDESSFGIDKRRNPGSAMMGVTAYLVQIATIYSSIVVQIHQSPSIPENRYDHDLEAFTQDTLSNMHAWEKGLKKLLFADVSEMKSGSKEGSRDELLSEEETGLHVIYHYSAMMLYRFVRFELMNLTSVQRNCSRAYGHARKLLELIHGIHDPSQKALPERAVATSSPVTVHAIVMAIDIITAAGTMSNVLEHQTPHRHTMMGLVYSGLEVLEKLTEQWHTAKPQLELVQKRVRNILKASESGASSRKMAFFFSEPLHRSFDRTQDIVYGLGRLDYLHALGSERMQEGDLHEIGGEGNRLW